MGRPSGVVGRFWLAVVGEVGFRLPSPGAPQRQKDIARHFVAARPVLFASRPRGQTVWSIGLGRPSGVVGRFCRPWCFWMVFVSRHLVLHNGEKISPGLSWQPVPYCLRAGREVKPWGLSVWAVRRGSSVFFVGRGRRGRFSSPVTRCSKTAKRYRPPFRGSPSRIVCEPAVGSNRGVYRFGPSVGGRRLFLAGRGGRGRFSSPAAWCSKTAKRYRPAFRGSPSRIVCEPAVGSNRGVYRFGPSVGGRRSFFAAVVGMVGFQPPRHPMLHNGKKISPGISWQPVPYCLRAGRGVKPWSLSVWAVRRGSSVDFGLL